MTVRLAIRGFAGREKQFEDRVDVDTDEMWKILPALAEKHANALSSHELHMIEIEFLDEPNENERFFRLGTDPAGMVMPIRVEL
jgi:hypothetical protein